MSNSFLSEQTVNAQLALAKDIDSIVQLQLEEGYNSWTKLQVAKLIADQTVLVCVNNHSGKVFACVFFSVVLDEAELLNIAVHSDFKQQGIATTLMEELISRLRKKAVVSIFLEVAVNNKPALILYTKFDFKQVGVRRAYYKRKNQNYDALVLHMSLSQIAIS
jgi:ribosomal-protein-alanine N-acetyltransferase